MSQVVTQEQVDEVYRNSKFRLVTLFDKTTVLAAQLPNGFVIVRSSSCIDPANYSEAVGCEACMKQVKEAIWEYLGYEAHTGLREKLSEAESLLSEAHNLLDDIHGYDTDTYRAISKYFNGEEDEVEDDE